jgi:poly(3-hydroxybutyrate) depolymerase
MKLHSARSCPATALMLVAALVAFGATPAPSEQSGSPSIRPGLDEQQVKFNGTALDVFTYRPEQCAPRALLLVFHGMKRNAGTYREAARKLADRNCLIIVAPLFDKRRFPTWSYQRGGIARDGAVRPQRDWTVNYVPDIADWARRATGLEDYYLIGHSAGAQFLSRVAAFAATQAKRIVIANPSTHVMPSLDVKAPYGLAGAYPDAEGTAALQRYLQQPVTILLGGDDDDEESEDLSRTEEAMQQGATRLQRGLNAFRAGEKAAADRGWAFNWRMAEVPGVGHSARRMFGSREAQDALSGK